MAQVDSKWEGVTGGRHPSPQGGARGARAARLSTESSPARDHPYRGSVSGQESRKPPAPRRDSGSSYARQLEAITMLIGLVRDSVLQCFCHSCRAPVLPAAHRRSAPVKKPLGKPRTKQPKKVKFITTEIRCQEMSKGGLAYEVILAEPVGAPAPPRRADSPEKSPTVEEIQEKLKAAEERRRSLEASKMAAIAQKMAKIEEASRIRSEQTNSFITSTKEALDAKMDSHVEKREAYINELRARLKDHLEGVEKTRLTLEQQTAEVYKAIEEKMNTAAAQRDENLKKMLERLREHEEQVRKVRTVNAERYQQLEAAIQEKHEQAAGRRQQIEDEQREKLRNHNTVKLAEARTVVESTITAKVEEISKDIETKLTAAEQNREKEIQKKLDFVKKEERRAEIVRQNKNARTDVTEATSG